MTDKCVYCDNLEGLEWHHILPRSLGGTDEKFNLIRVCNVHHALLHDLSSRGNIRELIKIGLAKAKADGRKFGADLVIPPQTLTALCEEKPFCTFDDLAAKYKLSRATIARNVTKWKDRLDEYEALFKVQLSQKTQPTTQLP